MNSNNILNDLLSKTSLEKIESPALRRILLNLQNNKENNMAHNDYKRHSDHSEYQICCGIFGGH